MTRRGRGLDWAGICAVLLAVGVIAVLIVGEVFAGLNANKTVTAEEVATVSTVLGAAVGALGGYLAGQQRRQPRNAAPEPASEPDAPDPDPAGMSGPGPGGDP